MSETTMPAASPVADDTSGASHVNESCAVVASIAFGRILNHLRFETAQDFLSGLQREETASRWLQLSLRVRLLSLRASSARVLLFHGERRTCSSAAICNVG
jgi:hypothetical protein